MLREVDEPLSIADLQQRCFRKEDEVRATLESLRATGSVSDTSNGAVLHVSTIRNTALQIEAAVRAFHKTHPDRAGLGRAEILSLIQAGSEVFDLAARRLCDEQTLECNGTVYSQMGWQAQVSDPDQQLCNQLAETYRRAGWSSPSATDLAAQLQEPVPRLETMIRLLEDRGLLVRLDHRISMHRDAIEAAKKVALRLFSRAASFSTMHFRDALGVSRKFAVPLLDYLDRTRFTVRSGHNRTPGAEARKQMAE